MQFFKIKKLNNNQFYFFAQDLIVPCQIGKHGIIKNIYKVEGDNYTPTGVFRLKNLYYRKEKIGIDLLNFNQTIKLKKITKSCGWCDDPNHIDYNKYINLKKDTNFLGTHENLWRTDDAYDLFFDLGYNTNPVKKFKGSAIFLHCSFKDERPTKGCVAIKKSNFYKVLKRINQPTSIIIEHNDHV